MIEENVAKDKLKIENRLTALEYSQKNTEASLCDVEKKVDLIIENHLPHIQNSINELGEKLCKDIKENYVSKDRFSPVEKIVYGMAGAVLSSFLLGVIYLLIK